MSDPINISLPKERNLYFTTQVDQYSIANLSKEIIAINDHDQYLEKWYKIHNLKYKPEPIQIFIDSYGGNVYQILGLIGIIEKSRTPIHTIVTGCAMSAGFLLLISGHKRFAYKYSTMMYHQVSDDTWGKSEHMKQTIKETKRLDKLLTRIVHDKTKLTKAQTKKFDKMKKDWFIESSQSLKLGIIDKII